MAYGLPSRGQQDWDDELNNSIEALKATADAAAAKAETARTTAVSAYSMAQSAGDLGSALADANASKIAAATSATAAAVSAAEAETAQTAAEAAQAAAEAAEAAAAALTASYVVRSQVRADGTDQSATLAAELAALYAAGGGTLRLPAGTIRINSAIVLPSDGSSTAPKQKPIRITGEGSGQFDGGWLAALNSGGTVLDLRYSGSTHPAKIVTYGAGTLEIDHLTFLSGGSDDKTFIFTTNTTLHIHHCAVYGNAAKTQQACVQDFAQFGGLTLPIGAGTDAPFQGYGSSVVDCFFSRIRTAIYGGLYANNLFITRLTASLTCGAPDATRGFIYFSWGCRGNIVSDLLIEAEYYVYAIVLDDFNIDHTFKNINIWDAPLANYLGAIYVGGVSSRNYFECGANGSTMPFVVEAAGSADKNTIVNIHSQAVIKYTDPITIPAVTGAGINFTGLATGSTAALRFKVTGQTDFTVYRPSNSQLRFEGVATTTTYRFIGQDLQVGANTNYGQLGSLGGTTRVYLRAEGSATDLTLDLRAKGTGKIELNSPLLINQSPATSATAGSASALPATPQGYFTMYDNGGVARKVPYYVS